MATKKQAPATTTEQPAPKAKPRPSQAKPAAKLGKEETMAAIQSLLSENGWAMSVYILSPTGMPIPPAAMLHKPFDRLMIELEPVQPDEVIEI